MKKKLLLLVSCLVLPLAFWALSDDGNGAEETYPVDVTSKITNPNLDDATTGWTITASGGSNGVKAASTGNPVYTGFNCVFDAHQAIEGLEPGVYHLKVQAFSRPGSNANSVTVAVEDQENYCYIVAGDVEQNVVALTSQWLEEAGSGTWSNHSVDGKTIYLPNNSDAFADAFKRGMYDNEVEFLVLDDEPVTIGVKNTKSTSGNFTSANETYAGFDNFRLYYYGPLTTVTPEMAEALVAVVPEGKMNAELKANIDKTVAALKAEPTAESYIALYKYNKEAKQSIATYEAVKAAFDKAAETELTDESRAAYTEAVAQIQTAYDNGTITGDGAAEVAAIEDALAAAVRADLANQSDKTALIVNPNLNDGTTGWTITEGSGGSKGVKAASTGNPVYTSFNCTFDVYQVIEGLEPGVYALKVQAFSRPASNANSVTIPVDEQESYCFIYANDREMHPVALTSQWLDAAGSGNWTNHSVGGKTIYLPDNSTAFADAFTRGMYDNELKFIVGDDGKAKIGVRNEAAYSSTGGAGYETYTGFDNFRLAYLGPVDQTAKIVNPQLNDDLNGWDAKSTTGSGGNYGVKAKDSGNPVYTGYCCSFDIHQTIEGLIPGNYILKVQAFSRPKANADSWTDAVAGKPLENYCYIFANDAKAYVKQITDEWLTSAGTGTWGQVSAGGQTVYLPNNSTAFADAFTRGMYDNELFCTVGEDGKLTIGIKNEATNSSSGDAIYAGFDNFRLYYTLDEPGDPEQIYNDAIAVVESYKTIAAQADDHAAFDAVAQAALETLGERAATAKQVDELKAEVLEALKTVLHDGKTATGQFDLTPIIANPKFDSNAAGWTIDGGGFAWNSIGVLQAANVKGGDKVYQVLHGMPAGKYTLKVQGYYQAQAWKQALYDREHGKEVNKLSLFLGDKTTAMKSIFDNPRNTLASACISRTEDVGAMVDGRGFPLMLSKVNESLAPGGYWTWLEAEVAEDGDITIGVNLDATDLADNWAIIDNFRLYYGERDTVVLANNTNYSMPDDTPAPVVIKAPASGYTAGTLYPFCAPCDIPGSCFKHVYEVGGVDYAERTVSVYPVNNLRAGVPSYVEFDTDVTEFEVGPTVLRAETADEAQFLWDGGLVYPYYRTLSWRSKDLSKGTKGAAYFTNVKVLSLDDMKFTANTENYQVRMFKQVEYAQSTASVVSTYNAVSPARRDLPHAVGIPVPDYDAAVVKEVKYGLTADLSDARTATVTGDSHICYIPNLIPGNTYYYQVVAGSDVLSKGQFDVEGDVRMIYAPSVYNLRDLGGYTVQDGRRTRYGLIYRGGEVNGFHAPVQDDLTQLKALGIGAEIDLRWRDDYDQDRETNKSGYGFVKGDTYYFAGANDFTADHVLNTETMARLKDEFRFLLRHIREGRGVHFHCVFGADRTGFFAFLIEGLLGFSLNDMYHDYEFTSFAAPAGNRNKSAIQERIAKIQGLAGATLRDKFENYWVNSVGISKDEVEEFRTIMLYDPVPVGIEAISTTGTDTPAAQVKSVYSPAGTQLPRAALGQRGLYIVNYTDGTSRKVLMK